MAVEGTMQNTNEISANPILIEEVVSRRKR
jgi:hypothetical protein